MGKFIEFNYYDSRETIMVNTDDISAYENRNIVLKNGKELFVNETKYEIERKLKGE